MPRLGLGSIDLSAIGVGGAVTGIDDFFFESFSAGQMHPMLTTSRTNLIEHSEDIGSNGFSPVGTTVVADQTTSPDGTQTADLLKEDNSSGSHFMFKDFNLSSGKTYTISVFAKSNGANRHLKYGDGGVGWSSGFNAFFDLTNGTTSGSGTVAIDDVGNGWFRCSVTGTTSATTSRLIIYSTLSGTTGYQGDNSSGIFLYGLQIEEDGFVSAYIPTSGSTVTVPTTLNDTSDVWDFDGTDIMIAEDPEDEGFWEEGSNLVLNHDYADLSSELITNGDFSQIGSERITNGDFATDSNWNINGTFKITNGRLHCISDGSFQYAGQGSIFEVGKTYKLTFDIVDYTSGSIRIRPSGQSPFNTYNANGTYTEYITATDATLLIERNSACDLFVDNVSVKEVGQDWGVYEDGTSTVTFEEGAVLNIDGSNSNVGVYQENVFANGKNYKIVVNMKATASFNAEILESQGASTVSTIGNVSLTTSYQEFTFYYQGTGTNDLFIHRLSSASGSNQKIYIKSASVKQVDPNDRWTLGTGWSIEDGTLIYTGTSNSNTEQAGILTANTNYELTYTVVTASGDGTLKLFGETTSTTNNLTQTVGTHTKIFFTDGANGTDFGFRVTGNTSGSFVVDNVTIREYAIKPKDI